MANLAHNVPSRADCPQRAGFRQAESRQAALVFPLILAALTVLSCASDPVWQTAVQDPRVRVEEVYPLVPFDREFVNRALAGGHQLSEFQYYISTGVILEEPSTNEQVRVTPYGDAIIQRRETVGQIQIDRGTQGVLFQGEDPARDSEMRVYFDLRYRNSPFVFVESPVDFRYYLEWDRAANTLWLNGINYHFRYLGDSPPCLMVRLKEDVYQRVNPVPMRGVAVLRAGIREGWSPPSLVAGRNDIAIPVQNTSREPVIISRLRLYTDSDLTSPPEIETSPGEIGAGTERIVVFRITLNRSRSRPGVVIPARIRLSLEFTDDAGDQWEDSRVASVNM